MFTFHLMMRTLELTAFSLLSLIVLTAFQIVPCFNLLRLMKQEINTYTFNLKSLTYFTNLTNMEVDT